MSTEKIYSINPCGLLFSKNGKLVSLNGEDYLGKNLKMELLTERKEPSQLTETELEININKVIFNRNYHLDQVRYEIIEKAQKKGKKKDDTKTS